MANRDIPGNGLRPKESARSGPSLGTLAEAGRLHPAWRAFIQFCSALQHGNVEQLKIQDGLPVLAEVTTKKVKFA
jgi:hypothetical protein